MAGDWETVDEGCNVPYLPAEVKEHLLKIRSIGKEINQLSHKEKVLEKAIEDNVGEAEQEFILLWKETRALMKNLQLDEEESVKVVKQHLPKMAHFAGWWVRDIEDVVAASVVKLKFQIEITAFLWALEERTVFFSLRRKALDLGLKVENFMTREYATAHHSELRDHWRHLKDRE